MTGTANELTADGTWNYSYDNEGNLIKKTKVASGETWTYTYDNLNRLDQAQDRATDGGTIIQTVSYIYDVLGNRIEEDVTAGITTTVTRFAYDGSDAWADLDASNFVTTRRLYLDAIDAIVARIATTGGVAAWYLTDRLGSVRVITDSTGAVQDTITYDGYGNVLIESNASFGDRYKFTAREFDSATGLQYNRARYYDPTIGRWTSQDPLGFDAGDANLYRYVRNRPTVERDSTGLIPSPPRPEPPLRQMPVSTGLEDRELSRLIVRLILKSIELCDRQTSFPKPNGLQKELIEINKNQIANLQNTIRERRKFLEEKDPKKKMEHKINLDSLERQQKQLDDREQELKRAINIK